MASRPLLKNIKPLENKVITSTIITLLPLKGRSDRTTKNERGGV